VPELVPIRCGRMLVSPFTFCREARIMADDLGCNFPALASGAALREAHDRQLPKWKGVAEIEHTDPHRMAGYRKPCGWTLARARARTGDRVAIASYVGNSAQLDRTILEFSGACAEQNECDYRQLVGAVNSGRVVAQAGP
jgi:Uncharacterized protein conserved in bacteria (DUF2252)